MDVPKYSDVGAGAPGAPGTTGANGSAHAGGGDEKVLREVRAIA